MNKRVCFPQDYSSQISLVLHDTYHPAISWPGFGIVSAYDILRVWIFGEIVLDEFSRVFFRQAHYDLDLVNKPELKANGVALLHEVSFDIHELMDS